MDYVLLDQLDSSRDDWHIKVRIWRIWESLNAKNNDELLSLDMIFIDEKENMIHATIRKNQVSRYRHVLREGSIFAVKNFKVVASSEHYQPISGEYRIFFPIFTSIKRLEDVSLNIARYGFQFLDYQTLESRINDNRVLSVMLGCLSAIRDIEVVGVGRKKRDIEIVTEQSTSVRITLWGKLAEKFDSSFYLKENGPFIVIVTSTTVKKFRGEIAFSSTGATQIYTNVEVAKVKSMLERFVFCVVFHQLVPCFCGANEFNIACIKFSGVGNGVEILEKQQSKEAPISEQMFFNRMTVKELLDHEWDLDVEEEFVIVRATITNIDTFFGWSYVSCNVCSKKLVAGDGLYICDSCNKECKFRLVKYKIHLRVADKTSSTTFVMFNMDAEKLLDTSAFKLLNKQGPNAGSLPVQIRTLCDENYIFRLKLNTYNIKEGMENYCISKVFEPNEKLELEFKAQKKGKKKLTALEDDMIGQAKTKSSRPGETIVEDQDEKTLTKGGS